MNVIDANAYVARVLELLGGREKAFEIIDAEFNEVNERWDRDVALIGRILRAHLHVEHYLAECIRHANPSLGNLDAARLTFAQKVELVSIENFAFAHYVPGIKHLNKIRNRLAHNLGATVTDDDARVFLANKFFSALREEGARRYAHALSMAPIDILEEFAKGVSSMLHGTFSAYGKASMIAMNEIAANTKK
jgi:hypothetical protein